MITTTVKLTGLPPDRVYDYVITAVTGQQVAAGRFAPEDALDLSQLVPGVYTVRLSACHAVSYIRVVKDLAHHAPNPSNQLTVRAISSAMILSLVPWLKVSQ